MGDLSFCTFTFLSAWVGFAETILHFEFVQNLGFGLLAT